MHAKEKSAKLKQGPNFIVAIPEAASRDEKLKFMCRAVLKVSERLNNSQINKDECPSLGKLLCESLSSSFQSASPLPLPLPLPHSFPVTLSVFLTYDSPRLQIESLVFYFFFSCQTPFTFPSGSGQALSSALLVCMVWVYILSVFSMSFIIRSAMILTRALPPHSRCTSTLSFQLKALNSSDS